MTAVLTAPKAIIAAAYDQLRTCGKGRAECVVFLLGPASDPTIVDELVHPAHLRRRGYYRVRDAWLDEFWEDLSARRKSVRMQAHTHGGRAFHSKTDDDWPLVHTAGYLSLVIPDFARGAADLAGAYLAELQSDGEWRQCRIGDRLLLA